MQINKRKDLRLTREILILTPEELKDNKNNL